MIRTFDVVLIAVVIAGAAWTFKVKHEAETLETAIAKVERQITKEKGTIALLEADWTVLNQPARLQGLAETFSEHLKLQPLDAAQIVQLGDLPRPVADETQDGGAMGALSDDREGTNR